MPDALPAKTDDIISLGTAIGNLIKEKIVLSLKISGFPGLSKGILKSFLSIEILCILPVVKKP